MGIGAKWSRGVLTQECFFGGLIGMSEELDSLHDDETGNDGVSSGDSGDDVTSHFWRLASGVTLGVRQLTLDLEAGPFGDPVCDGSEIGSSDHKV